MMDSKRVHAAVMIFVNLCMTIGFSIYAIGTQNAIFGAGAVLFLFLFLFQIVRFARL